MSLVPVTDIADLHNTGAQPFGAYPKPFPLTAITATGTLQNRPTTGNPPSGPGYFKALCSAAAANVQTLPDTGAGWLQDDVVAFEASPAVLANSLTVSDASGPTTIAILAAAARGAIIVRFNGTGSGVRWSLEPGSGALT
jgi:hypothetical protein